MLDLWRTLPAKDKGKEGQAQQRFPSEPQENLLYFIEKNAPLLEPWQREIVRIVRKVAQYFYPQRQTQVMNEGWATFWHYTILQLLADNGGRSMPIYDSQAETDDGFATYEEAQSAAALKTKELTTTVEAMKE